MGMKGFRDLPPGTTDLIQPRPSSASFAGPQGPDARACSDAPQAASTERTDARLHPVVINGRFLTSRRTGVQRVAEELTIALDELLGEGVGGGREYVLAVPANAGPRQPLRHISVKAAGVMRGQRWEQLTLPRLARGALLLNLCNLGPLFKRDAITMIHDAQVFSAPTSYASLFRLEYRLAHPLIGRLHSRVLTVSQFSKQELIRFGVAREERITVIPNGADHVLRWTSDTGPLAALELDGKPFVLALASVQRHKNIALLLKAFAQPELSGVKLVLFGSASRADFLAQGWTVPDNVVFTGMISDNAIRGLMENAICLAFPSLTEGFGLPPVEAMTLGCPVVVAPAGALPETCGTAALYAAADSPVAWRDAILRLWRDPVFAAAQRAEGRAHAAKFTWRRSAEMLIEVLNSTA